jgi:ubiquitin
MYILTRVQTPQPVYIKTLTGKTIKLIIRRQDTIKLVKRKLEAQEGYRAEDQQLIFAARVLDNNRTVADCNIKREDTIYLAMRPTGAPFEPKRGVSPADNNKFKVYVQGEGADMTVDVQAYDTCLRLKEKIANFTGIPPYDQILNVGFRVMDGDAQTLRFYQITSGDVITLRRASKGIP